MAAFQLEIRYTKREATVKSSTGCMRKLGSALEFIHNISGVGAVAAVAALAATLFA